MKPPRRVLALAIAVACLGCTHPQTRRPASFDDDLANRISSRSFPSIFQAWSAAENFNSTVTNGSPIPTVPVASIEPDWITMARHDLVWRGPTSFRLGWNNSQYNGLATDFTPASLPGAQSLRAELLAANPHLVILAEIRYHDGIEGYLPDDSPWWLRDAKGNRIPANQTVPGAWYLLDYNNPDFQDSVAQQCQAVVKTLVVDGCMLDWWAKEDAGRLALIQKIRKAIGDTPILMVNVNQNQPVQSAPYINGMYMEGMLPKALGGIYDWTTAATNLLWAQSNLRQPAFTALDAWTSDPKVDPTSLGRNNVALMRFSTTLALTHSDGYTLFADPNSLPTPDHLHDWYPFWNKGLGHPSEPPGERKSDGAFIRDFENGQVACNPPDNGVAHFHFDAPHVAMSTGKRSTDFNVAPGDGDIFLK